MRPRRFLLLREFFLESYDKRLFNDCKEIWNELRVFEVRHFLENFENFSKNKSLEKEIRCHLRSHFEVEGKKPFYKTISTEFGLHTLEVKKSLVNGLDIRQAVEVFEEFAQKIFLKEFGIVLELKDSQH